MENNGNIICRARFKGSKLLLIITILFIILGVVICIALNRSAINKKAKEYQNWGKSYTTYADKGTFDIHYGVKKSWEEKNKNQIKNVTDTYEDRSIYAFGIEIYHNHKFDREVDPAVAWGDAFPKHKKETTKKTSGIIVCVLFVVISFVLLFYALAFIMTGKRCSLELSEEKISGQLKKTFSKKRLQIPIDHLDNVMTSNGIMDKIRGGETLLISSNSGLIKFHYVQNAEEFAQAAMKRIDEVKRSATAAAPASAPVQNVTGNDAMEKLNSLKQMLENGLITQEQFDQKREEILSKM